MNSPASILYKSTSGRYRAVSYPDVPITATIDLCRILTGRFLFIIHQLLFDMYRLSPKQISLTDVVNYKCLDVRKYAPSEDTDQSVLLHRIPIDASFLHMTNEDFDQTARMRSLILVFFGCTCPKVRFLTFLLIKFILRTSYISTYSTHFAQRVLINNKLHIFTTEGEKPDCVLKYHRQKKIHVYLEKR